MKTILTVVVASVFFCYLNVAMGSQTEKIPPKVAGAFYSADPQELSSQIELFFMNVPSRKLKEDPVALWVPHAGLQYSGQIAAMAYYEVKGKKYDSIILLGPSHHEPVDVVSIYPRGVFQTPLGDVAIDEALAKKIADQLPDAKFDARPYAQEHSLEVQLPFILKTFHNPKVVTMLLGPMDRSTDMRIAKAIAKACEGRKVLLIASSDMSHYPRGSDAAKIDENSLNMVRRFDPELFPGYTQFVMSTGVDNLACLFCGDGALTSVMEAAHLMGANDCNVLGYTNTSEVTGDRSRAVGYGAAAFFKNPAGSPFAAAGSLSMFETPEGRKHVLDLARNAIEGYAGSQKSVNVSLQNPEFFRPQRIFVTIKKGGKLRGCIGNPNAALPLYEAVIRMATSAGFKDPRFSPLSAQEAKVVKIEMSVLGNFQRIKNSDEIQMGKQGVIVRRDGKEGLFLPEVAEQLPNKDEFLDRLCEEKAGLPANAWKDPQTELWTFTTLHFSEE